MRLHPTARKLGWAAWFLLCWAASLAIAFSFSGCGDEGASSLDGAPTVRVVCDVPVEKNRCTIIAHNATSVEAFYNDTLAWWDRGITEDRVVYVDSPGAVLFSVEACNDFDCAVAQKDLR